MNGADLLFEARMASLARDNEAQRNAGLFPRGGWDFPLAERYAAVDAMVEAITAGSDVCAHRRTARYLNQYTHQYVRWCQDCLKEPVTRGTVTVRTAYGTATYRPE